MIDLNKLRRRVGGEPTEQGVYGPTWLAPHETLSLIERLEAAEKDAARYKFLRHGGISKLPHSDWDDGLVYDEREALDAHIDAAMASK